VADITDQVAGAVVTIEVGLPISLLTNLSNPRMKMIE
jgi:hypothetical protein